MTLLLLRSLGLIPRPLGRFKKNYFLFDTPSACGGVVHYQQVMFFIKTTEILQLIDIATNCNFTKKFSLRKARKSG